MESHNNSQCRLLLPALYIRGNKRFTDEASSRKSTVAPIGTLHNWFRHSAKGYMRTCIAEASQVIKSCDMQA